MVRTDWIKMDEDSEERGVNVIRRVSRQMSQKVAGTWWGRQVVVEVKEVLFESKLNVLLLLTPLAVVANFAGWPDAAVFLLALLPLCSLAERLGFVTEQLAMYTNDTLGGLLNASFGNATEVLIAAFALKRGYLRIVQLTLLGSIISNLLLVLGSAFIAGGIKHKVQKFNLQGVTVNCSLLILACVAILLPSMLSETHTEANESTSELALSRFESVFMLLCYCLYLVFQLCTHRHLYEASEEDPSKLDAAAVDKKSEGALSREASVPLRRELSSASADSSGLPMSALEVELVNGIRKAESALTGRGEGSVSSSVNGGYLNAADDAEAQSRGLLNRDVLKSEARVVEEEEEEEKVLSLVGCFLWLTLITLLISLLSDFIMKGIKGASKQLKLPMPFLTTILVPIVGNAAEHSSAILFAYRNRIEISLGVAVGSSTQVGVLVVPICVVLGWMMGQPLDLNFNSFESSALLLSVLLVIVALMDGTGNWIKGTLLLITYFFIAAGFFAHKDKDLTGSVDDLN